MEKCVKCDKDTDDWFKFAGNDGEPQTSCRESMEVVTVVSLVGIAEIAAWACWKNKE